MRLKTLGIFLFLRFVLFFFSFSLSFFLSFFLSYVSEELVKTNSLIPLLNLIPLINMGIKIKLIAYLALATFHNEKLSIFLWC